MTYRFCSLAAAAWIALGLAAVPVVAAEDDHVLRRLTPPSITSMVIGARSSNPDREPDTDCSKFAVTPAQARFFLRHAQAISKRAHDHDHPWTTCRIDGTVKYANGMRAEWSIDAGGRGILMPINGKRKHVVYFLYCEACLGIPGRR